ncbi:MAG: hypothetical protein AAFU85_18395, partial [Planctomycetota bacterium]
MVSTLAPSRAGVVMFEIDQRLRYTASASMPTSAEGIWFPGLVQGTERWRDLLVELLRLQEREASPMVYRIDAGSAVELCVFASDGDIEIAINGGIPLVTWTAETGSTGLVIWHPYNASVFPGDSFADEAAVSDAFHFWHPVHGLLRLEAANRFEAIEFFESPPDAGHPWRTPPEFLVRFPVIRDLHPAEEPEVSAFLAEGNEDIGADSEGLAKATRDESAGALTKAKRRILEWIDEKSSKPEPSKPEPTTKQTRSAGGKLAAGSGGTSGPSAIGRLIGTVSRSLAERLSRRLQAERERQIGKLLDLMRSDPDRALRFALPIGGEGGFRGFARPGARLQERTPDFSMSGLAGGGPVDCW